MATLANLFVSYKSVQPIQNSSNISQKGNYPNIMAAKSRLQQLESQSATETTPMDIEESNLVNSVDSNTKDNDLTWLTKGLPSKVKQFEAKFATTLPGTAYNRGHLDEEISSLFKKHGINITVTSGKRLPGVAGKAGSQSFHVGGNAVDIVPGPGETFASLKQKMSSNPEIQQFFRANGLGVIDETNPATKQKTGATGNHFHIGPDKLAQQTWSKWLQRTAPATKLIGFNYALKGDIISKAAEYISQEENKTSFNAPLSRKMLVGYQLPGEKNKTYGYGLVYNPEHTGKLMSQIKSSYTQPELQRLAKKIIEGYIKKIDGYGLNLSDNQKVALAHKMHFSPKLSQEFLTYMKQNGVVSSQGFFNWWYNKYKGMRNASRYLNGWTNSLKRAVQLWKN